MHLMNIANAKPIYPININSRSNYPSKDNIPLSSLSGFKNTPEHAWPGVSNLTTFTLMNQIVSTK